MNLKSLAAAYGHCRRSVPCPSAGQQPLKIGFITTLSGPAGYIGADIRDAFQLAIDIEGGKLGGIPVQLIVEDDGFKPGQGKQVADRFLKTENIKLFTGIVFSNIAGATVPDILDAGAIYVSPNAGAVELRRQGMSQELLRGVLAERYACMRAPVRTRPISATSASSSSLRTIRPARTRSPASSGFFKGEIVGEVYTRLDQTDYAPEMAQIRAAKPDAVFQFHPGGLGIAFIRQYQQAGLLGTIPMVVASPSIDVVIVKAVGEAALGINGSTQWNTDFDNPANKKFMAEWQKKFGTERLPTYYASQGYDTALAIAAALKATNGNVTNTEAFRTAMLKADFQAVRGAFKFGPNQHPIQDWYAIRVEKDADGKPVIKTIGKILSNRGDAYSKDCKL